MNNADQAFQDAFPTLARLIDATGCHRIEITHALNGNDTTVVIKRRDNHRGWGLTWIAASGELRGMRSHRYIADNSDASPTNAAFLEEIGRRLEVVGVTLHEAGGYIDPMHKFARKKPPVVRALAERAY